MIQTFPTLKEYSAICYNIVSEEYKNTAYNIVLYYTVLYSIILYYLNNVNNAEKV